MSSSFKPFDTAEYLDNDAVVAEYLTAAVEDPNPDVFLAALGDVAKARGMAEIARESGLGRESLYKSLGAGAHPRYETINAVLKALGVRIEIVSAPATSVSKGRLSEEPAAFDAEADSGAWKKLTSMHLERLYKPIGEIMVQWALLDVSLHDLGFAMFKIMGTTPTKQRWQSTFGPRLSDLEKLFRRSPFSLLEPAAKPLIREIRHLQELRNMLVHGAAVRYSPGNDGVIWRRIDKVTKLQRQTDPEISHLKSHMLVRFAELTKASDRCTRVNEELLTLRNRVFELSAHS